MACELADALKCIWKILLCSDKWCTSFVHLVDDDRHSCDVPANSIVDNVHISFIQCLMHRFCHEYKSVILQMLQFDRRRDSLMCDITISKLHPADKETCWTGESEFSLPRSLSRTQSCLWIWAAHKRTPISLTVKWTKLPHTAFTTLFFRLGMLRQITTTKTHIHTHTNCSSSVIYLVFGIERMPNRSCRTFI